MCAAAAAAAAHRLFFFLVRHIVVWLPISNTKTPFGNPAYVIGYFILLLMCVYFVRHLVGGFCDFVSLDNFNLKWFANSINVDCRNEINTQFNVATSECRMDRNKGKAER